jgi:hypothetical protein
MIVSEAVISSPVSSPEIVLVSLLLLLLWLLLLLPPGPVSCIRWRPWLQGQDQLQDVPQAGLPAIKLGWQPGRKLSEPAKSEGITLHYSTVRYTPLKQEWEPQSGANGRLVEGTLHGWLVLCSYLAACLNCFDADGL